MDYPLDHPEIRDGIRRLCADFDNRYWQECDASDAYPADFVEALTKAGYLAALIPEA
ncbi:MAG: acyl-CoA dehydrogenase family protein, partial [Pseudomonadota bacterium]|nr:acyl-CoA dehydrogenase family protein [Pseudomonadota bacterium]MEC7245307.1 acyl-CoA dehydrogenase family protein [Pseudomonadota bacterium]